MHVNNPPIKARLHATAFHDSSSVHSPPAGLSFLVEVAQSDLAWSARTSGREVKESKPRGKLARRRQVAPQVIELLREVVAHQHLADVDHEARQELLRFRLG